MSGITLIYGSTSLRYHCSLTITVMKLKLVSLSVSRDDREGKVREPVHKFLSLNT